MWWGSSINLTVLDMSLKPVICEPPWRSVESHYVLLKLAYMAWYLVSTVILVIQRLDIGHRLAADIGGLVQHCYLHSQHTRDTTVLLQSIVILVVWYSVSPIYRGRVYRGIGYIAVACWTPFFGAQERDIFREIAVTPWTQFAGDNFSRNLLTAIAFVPGSQETIFREINSSLPVNAG